MQGPNQKQSGKPAPAAKAVSITSAIHPLSLARAVWKRKLLALFTTAVLSCGGAFVVHRLPAVYKAEALVLVDPQVVPEKFVASTVVEDVQERMGAISQEALSNTRLMKIIDDLNLYANERKTHVKDEIVDLMRTRDLEIHLEKGMSATARAGAFRITYQGPDPHVVASVVNRITDFYIQENLRSRESQAEGTSEFIDSQLQDAKRVLDTQEAAVSAYKLQHNGELPQQENSLIAVLTNLQMGLQGNQDALNRAQQNKVMLESAIGTAETTETSFNRAVESRQTGETEALGHDYPDPKGRKKSEVLAAELEAARLKYTDDHPDVRRLRDEVATTRQQERAEEVGAQATPKTAGVTGEAKASRSPQESPELRRERTQARERIKALKSQLALALEEIRSRTEEREKILAQIATHQSRIEQLPVREQEMAALTRDYEFSKANYRSLSDKKIAAEMSTDLEKRKKAEKFRVVDRAREPQKPSKPNRPVLYGIVALMSFLAGLATAIGREFSQGVVLGEWEVPGDVVVLSRVPFIESMDAGSDPERPVLSAGLLNAR